MNHYLFLLIFFSFGIFGVQSKSVAQKKSVNILLMMADDLGYGDVGCYGSAAVETPNIDQLANGGMKFVRFYAGSAVCSPSRASVLSGLFPLRMDIRQAFNDKDDAHLPMQATIIPELLKGHGYFTSFIGKWHLGGISKKHIDHKASGNSFQIPGPLEQGFEHYLATIEGEPPRQSLIRNKTMYQESGKYLVRNDRRIPPIEKQWDEIKVDETINVIGNCQKSKKPFFIELAFDAPHTPYENAPAYHVDKYSRLGLEGDQLAHRSRISHLDEQVGRVFTFLKQSKLLENTIIIFTSDNGSIREGSSGPFKGAKTDLHEGGLRVPFIVYWQGNVLAGSNNFSIGHHVDILPTICDIVGVDYTNLNIDGRSLAKALKNEYVNRTQTLLFQMDKYPAYQGHGKRPEPHIAMAAIKGNWKLTSDMLESKELFHLGNDYQESNNLIGKYVDIETNLENELINFWNHKRMSPYKK